jgi:hypothetical protein
MLWALSNGSEEMKKIKWHAETNMHGSRVEGETEVDDAATDEEIEDQVREEVFNVVSWGWEAA